MTVVSRWEAQRDRLMNGNGCRTVDGKTYILLDRPSIPFPWAHGFEINDEPDQDGMIEMATIDKGGKAYRIMNDADQSGKEYYLIQNIQQKGWNTQQKGHGMLVYHVNYDESVFSLSSNKVNDVEGKPRMAVSACR